MLHTSMIRRFVGALAITAALAVPAAAEELKVASWVPPAHVITSSTLDPLHAALAAANADIDIKVYPGGELGKGPLEQYVRVVQGVADIAWGLPGYTSSQFPKTMVSELPGALPDGMTGYDMIANAYEKGLLDAEFPGTKALALWLSEPNIFIMKDRTVRTPDDIKGLKMRVSGSAAAAAVESLGATPVQMPAGEIYNALQTGLIDGVITGASAVGDFKLNEVANSYTIGAPLGRISFYLVMNKAKYDGLNDAQKAAIDSIAGRKLSKSAEEGWNARAASVLESLKADSKNTVVELSADEAAKFGEKTLPVTDKIVGELGAGDVLKAMHGQ